MKTNTNEILQKILVSFETKPHQIKLTQISKLKDLEEPTATAVKALYKHSDFNCRLFGTLLNAMVTQKRVVFLLSVRLMEGLLKKDRNTKRNSISQGEFKRFIAELLQNGTLTKLQNGEGRSASIFALSNPDFSELVLDHEVDFTQKLAQQLSELSQLLPIDSQDFSRKFSHKFSGKSSHALAYALALASAHDSGSEEKSGDRSYAPSETKNEKTKELKIEESENQSSLSKGFAIPKDNNLKDSPNHLPSDLIPNRILEADIEQDELTAQSQSSLPVTPTFDDMCLVLAAEKKLPNFQSIADFVQTCLDHGIRPDDLSGYTFIRIVYSDSRPQAKSKTANWKEWKTTARAQFDSIVAKLKFGHLPTSDGSKAMQTVFCNPERVSKPVQEQTVVDTETFNEFFGEI